MTQIPSVKLLSGYSIPKIGFGTGTALSGRRVSSEFIVSSLSQALKAGFRHIDTAQMYANEAEVGIAIEETGIKREDIYLTTKLSTSFEDPEGNLDRALKDLKTDYIDLYLIHNTSFVLEGKITIEGLWKSFEKIAESGKARTIGISNFSVSDLEKILAVCKIKPAVLQIEYSPYVQNQYPGIVEFAKKHNIAIESYGSLSPLTKRTNGPLDQTLVKIADKYGKTVTQIILRWVLETDVIPITTTRRAERLPEILDLFSFNLTAQEVKEITDIGATYSESKL